MLRKFNPKHKFLVNNGLFYATEFEKFLRKSYTTTNESPMGTISIPPKNKVVIVGAGVAGLSAADHLIKNGIKDVLILEAAERYGGRIHTAKMGDAICELGAKWINVNESPDSVYTLAKQGGLIDRKSFDNGAESFFIMNRETMDEDLVQLVCLIYRDLVKAAEQYLIGEIPVKHRTVDTYLKDRINTVLKRMPESDSETAKQVFDALMRNLSCQLGSDLAYIHVKQLGNISKHLDKPIYIPSGLDKIFNQLVKSIPVDRLLIGKPIGGIRWANIETGESPYVTCLDGSKYLTDHIICTIPLGALSAFSQHFFNPKLPDTKIDAINKLGRGSPGKIYLHYKEPITSWFVGSVMLGPSTENLSSRDNWTAGISEIASVPDSKNVLEVKIGGSYNETVERCTEDLVDRELTNAIRKIMKNNKIPRPMEILRSFWSTDARTLCGLPFISIGSSEGCIGDFAAPLTDKRNPQMPVVLFAGDATSFEGFGTVEGARLSGIREATRILDLKF